jgi:hypothetical protein
LLFFRMPLLLPLPLLLLLFRMVLHLLLVRSAKHVLNPTRDCVIWCSQVTRDAGTLGDAALIWNTMIHTIYNLLHYTLRPLFTRACGVQYTASCSTQCSRDYGMSTEHCAACSAAYMYHSNAVGRLPASSIHRYA